MPGFPPDTPPRHAPATATSHPPPAQRQQARRPATSAGRQGRTAPAQPLQPKISPLLHRRLLHTPDDEEVRRTVEHDLVLRVKCDPLAIHNEHGSFYVGAGSHSYGRPVENLDVDRFKEINDSRGHDTGDKVLRMVARTLGGNLRSVDAVGRWGGDEFVAVIANTTAEQLLQTAERSRKLVAASSLDAGLDQIRVTVSIGATMAQAEDTPQSLVQRADSLMYRAKAGGRNRVEFADSPARGPLHDDWINEEEQC